MCEVDEGDVEELEVVDVEEEEDEEVVVVVELVWEKDENELLLEERLEEEKVEESLEETGVGLLLALELGVGVEVLAGSDDGVEVTDGAAEEGVGVLVELLEDIVNCLPKTSFLGFL